MQTHEPNIADEGSGISRRVAVSGAVTGVFGAIVTAASGRLGSTTFAPTESYVQVAGDTLSSIATPNVTTPNSFGSLIARHARMLNGGGLYTPSVQPFRGLLDGLDSEVASYLASLNTSTNRTYLWNDPGASTGSANMTYSANRLRLMAIQYTSVGSRYHLDASLFGTLAAALQWLSENRYMAGASETGNWWDWKIGTPLAILDLLALLHAQLDALLVDTLLLALKAHAGTVTGAAANRAWSARVVMLRAMLSDDVTAFNNARAALAILCSSVVTSGDGFYADNSFVQHGDQAYTGAYGIEMYYQCAWLVYLVAGAPDSMLPTSTWSQLRDWTYTAFEPLLFRGSLSNAVMGRATARVFTNDHSTGHGLLAAVLLLAEIAATSDAGALKSLAKTQIMADTARDYFVYDPVTKLGKLTIDSARLGSALANDVSVPMRTEPNATIVYAAMDRVAHRRPGFAMAFSMYSSRIANYESINGENLHGWNTGAGMIYFLNAAQLDHYQDDYWPTVDPYRLPGTTLDRHPRTDAEIQGTRGSNAWVGGVSNLTCGVVCMGIGTSGSYIRARKSWLIVSDYIICIGSGITCTSSYGVETIVENRNLGTAGAEQVRMNATSTIVLDTVEQTEVLQANWLSLDNVGGYVPLGVNPPLRGLRTNRSGTWRSINSATTSPTDVRTRQYATLWFDHGTAPVDAVYTYVFLPNASAALTASFAQNPRVVVTRTNDIHFARSTFTTLTVYSGMFWAAGSADVVTTSAPVAISIRVGGGQAIIAVSDPSQLQTAPISVTIWIASSGVASQDPEIAVARSATDLTLTFQPAGLKGATRKATVML